MYVLFTNYRRKILNTTNSSHILTNALDDKPFFLIPSNLRGSKHSKSVYIPYEIKIVHPN